MLHIPIVHAHDVSKHIPREKFSIELKTLWNNWFICQLCIHWDMKHLGSLESTQEARVAQGVVKSNSYPFFMLSKLPKCFISWWMHPDVSFQKTRRQTINRVVCNLPYKWTTTGQELQYKTLVESHRNTW